MNPTEPWFEDEENLIHAVKSSGWNANEIPEVEGYSDLVELSRGGQGIVYSATQESTKRKVAIKVLLHSALASEFERRRFEREIELVASLHNPAIVRIYDSGTTSQGLQFYVMEHIEGSTMDSLTIMPSATNANTRRQGQKTVDETGQLLSQSQRLETFLEICDAVNYAHQQGIIHRDLKPGNILLDQDGRPHLLDFGLAKFAGEGIAEGKNQMQMSAAGQFMGSLPWTSPEQAKGVKNSDTRSDVYSLGVILFQLITGRFPYDVKRPFHEVLDTIVNTPPASPRDYVRSVDSDLETIVLKCLHKEADRRYQNVGALADDIRSFLSGLPIQARRDSLTYVTQMWIKRHRFAAASLSAFVLATVVFAVTMTFLYRRAVNAEATTSRLYHRAVAAEELAADRLEQVQGEFDKFAAVNEFLLSAFLGRRSSDPVKPMTIKEGVDRAAARIETQFPDKPEIKAELHLAMGFWYQSLKDFENAVAQQKKYIDLRTRLFGEDDRQVAVRWGDMGWFAMNTNHPQQAEEFLRTALNLKRKYFPPDDSSTAKTLLALGSLLTKTDRPQEAELLLRESLDICRGFDGKERDWVVFVENALGACLTGQNRFAEAEPLLLETYQLMEEKYGSANANTRLAIERLVEFYRATADAAETEKYRELLK